MKSIANAVLLALPAIIWTIDESVATQITIEEACELNDESKFLKADTIVEVRPITASFWKHGSITTTEKREPRPDQNLPEAYSWSDPQIVSQSASGNVWTFEYRFRARTVLDATYKVQRSFKGDLRPGSTVSLRKSCAYPNSTERRLPPTTGWRHCRTNYPLPNQGLSLKGVAVQNEIARPLRDKRIILYLTRKPSKLFARWYSRNFKGWYYPNGLRELPTKTIAYCEENSRPKKLTAEQRVQFKRLQSLQDALEAAQK